MGNKYNLSQLSADREADLPEGIQTQSGDSVHDKSAPFVLHHLIRYWAISATYDSVAFSFVVLAIALVAVQFNSVAPEPLDHGVGSVGALLCMCAALCALRRGASSTNIKSEML
jgi:hypothetical protein